MKKTSLGIIGAILSLIISGYNRMTVNTEYFFPLNTSGEPVAITTKPPTTLLAYNCVGQANYCAAGFTRYVTVSGSDYSAVVASWIVGTTAHKN
jgi:hypothetical protein